MAGVVIVGGTEETRLLLRGLLRLHRHRILAEGPSFDALSGLPSGARAEVAVVDIDLEDDSVGPAIADALTRTPGLHMVLLTPSRTPQLEARAKELGIARVVRRPFAVHELVEAVERPPPSPPSGLP